jgi:TetR/AcrR family transcriptional repressor of nem operon
MKKSREETILTRERILASAARRFRESGFDGVSVKDLMHEAGLTHGAFYAHFPSKDALIGAACTAAFSESANQYGPRAEEGRPDAVRRFLERYLSKAHLEAPGSGCMVPALAAEASRGSAEVQRTFSHGIAAMIDRLADVTPGDEAHARRQRAIATLAEAVGAVVLARALEPGELQDSVLEAVRQHLLKP